MAKKKVEETKAADTGAAKPEVKEKPAPVPKPAKDEQNGIPRPKADTATGRVWGHADKISTAKSAPAARKDVIEACVAEGINASTAATQYGRWRTYNGLGKEAKVAEAPAAE